MTRALQIANRQIRDLQNRCCHLTTEAKRQERLLQEIQPKADYLDKILHSSTLTLTTQIAKDYGMSTVRFNHLLADLGIQYKVREQWVLYAKYQDQGYTASKCFEVPQSDGSLLVKYQTEWTQKGRRFLYLFLKEKIVISCELHQLPAPKIEKYEDSTRVTLFSNRSFSTLSSEDRLWACYLHACVMHVQGEQLTNSSLRKRFGLKESSSGSISRLIKDAVEKGIIKPLDPNTAPRYMKYLPGWA